MDPLLNCVKEEQQQEFYSSQETLVYGGNYQDKKNVEEVEVVEVEVETTPLIFNNNNNNNNSTNPIRKKKSTNCRWFIISVVLLLLITLGSLLLTMFVFIPNAKREEITRSISNLFLDSNSSSSLCVFTLRQDEIVFSMDSLFFKETMDGLELKELYLEYNSTRIGGIVKAEESYFVLSIENQEWLGLYLRDLLLFQQENYEDSTSTLKLHYSLEFQYNFIFPLKQKMEFQRVHTLKPTRDLIQSSFRRFYINSNYTFTIELFLLLLRNPDTSQLFKEVNLSQFTFQLVYKDIVIGIFTIDKFKIQFLSSTTTTTTTTTEEDNVLVGRGELILPSSQTKDYHYRDLFSEFISRIQNGVEWNDFKLEIKSYSSSSAKMDDGGLPPIARVLWLEQGLGVYRREIQYRDQRPSANGQVGLLKITQFSVEKFNLKIRRLYDYAPVLNGIFRFQVNDSIVQFNVVKTRYRLRLYKLLGEKRVLLGYTETQYDNTINPNSNDTVITARFNIPSKDDFYLKVVSVQDYQRFVSDIVQLSQVGIYIEGNVDFIVQYQRHGEKDAAEYELRNIPFSSLVELEGMALDNSSDKGGEEEEYFYFEDSPVIRDQVDIGGDLSVQLDGYMKVIGEKQQTGLQLLSSVDFHIEYGDCGHREEAAFSNSTVVGVMKLDSIDLSGAGCVVMNNRNQSAYCTIFPSLLFSMPPDEILCEDCIDGHGRQFMSALLFKDHFNVSLKAIHTESPDFREALKYFQFQNVSLKGYTPRNITKNDQEDKSDDKKEENEQQFQLIRRLIVQPSTTILFGQLNAWIDFYNPFELNSRYYYLNLGLYLNEKIIGRIQVNLTDYDPFMFSKNAYIPRAMQSKRDPYGPHPSQLCLNPGDCQIGPIDVRTTREVKAINATRSKEEWQKDFELIPRIDTGCVRSDRMTLNLRLTDAYVMKFWKYLTEKEDVKFNVTLKGKVAVGMGTQFYNNTKRTTTFDCPERKFPDGYIQERSSIRDPYCYPDRPKDENVNVMWLDYEQELTEVEIKKAGQKPPTVQKEEGSKLVIN